MPTTNFATPEKYQYLNGFGSFHESEAVADALPIGANSPQKPPHGLYAEKLSGTAFTAPRQESLQSWLYRILPSAAHSTFEPLDGPASAQLREPLNFVPNQLRWDPFDVENDVDWVRGLRLVAGAGDPTVKTGLGIYIFTAGRDMDRSTAIYSSDGEMLVVAQQGVLDIQTELGNLLVRPNEIVVLPRGIKYRGHFTLPELGPIGSNCLANQRDFQVPTACFEEDTNTSWSIVNKYNGQLFTAKQNHTPFDVVAWHDYPYKYDLGRFSVIGSVSFDHPDPSIYTVLTGPSDHPGTAVADFVIFPPRWLVQEDTFRPPWYHRNAMSEFMGLVCGEYDAKAGGGFRAGGASLHNVMSAHGPDARTFKIASNAELQPQKIGEGSMAFMFESCLMLGLTKWGLETCCKVQTEYNQDSWSELRPHFKRP
ncbi:homogentisate 1,2-dioxygenase domain-containing protein [Hirsutella rhossiliensis]|uniref:homogentisate 1,2-dioxygenase n=1 Tax=Hirsutella rhossiliensis TaxID=111463 RepID=A0A9P8MMU1_9HYPO|nr:homogentisate 1,2-dioxygenase domain-containing protein [Hirsutella rhossiliensis]KAH0958187.1 homogentisate 1,2-dioxygenase domain-containing protein [Hirsutella rhossiliensis]